MCAVCGRSPCHPRCPNAPEPRAVYECKICHEGITAGEDYYEMDGEQYHEECFRDNAVEILEKECGAFKTVAEEGDRW